VLELQGLSRRYGDVIALDDLSFTVREGQMFGFVGPNGAGKTTTMRIVLGVLEPDRGEVRWRPADGRRDPQAGRVHARGPRTNVFSDSAPLIASSRLIAVTGGGGEDGRAARAQPSQSESVPGAGREAGRGQRAGRDAPGGQRPGHRVQVGGEAGAHASVDITGRRRTARLAGWVRGLTAGLRAVLRSSLPPGQPRPGPQARS
jgi:energy-coupling factor transporter ATP-binding protein EcfA2